MNLISHQREEDINVKETCIKRKIIRILNMSLISH